jgi:hypothetical protein
VVEPVDRAEGRELDGFHVTPGTAPPGELGLVQADARLGERVVVRVTDAAHRRLDAGLCQAFGVTDRQILRSAVAVMDELSGAQPDVDCLLEGVESQIGPEGPRHPPADKGTGEDVDEECNVGEARPGRDVRDARDPELVRSARAKLAMNEIARPRGVVGHRRDLERPTSNSASRAHHPHEPLHVHRATRTSSPRSCRQTFSAPYTAKFSCQKRRTSVCSSSSRFARLERLAWFRRQLRWT